MYGKVFRQMYKGSMFRTGWEAIVTMQQFIVLADRDGIVDMTLEAIAAETTIPLEVLQKGLGVLMSPDPNSRTPDEDGKRVELLDERRDWGWRLINFQKYRKLQSEEDRREYHRQYWHKRQKNKTQQASTDSIQADAEAKAEAKAVKKLRTHSASPSPALEAIRPIFPKRAGSQPWAKAEKAIHARLSEGERVEVLMDGARRYAEFCRVTGKLETEYVMQAATFFGPDRRYLEAWAAPATKADVRLAGNLDAAAEFMRRTDHAAQ